MTRVILVASPLDPATSYEYHNLLRPLENMGCEVVPFDFGVSMRALGREQMNRELLAVVLREGPELVIFVPQTDQFLPDVVDEINRHAITLAYLYDDMWRIEYSRFWARHFAYVTTSDVNGLRKFRDAGFTNVLYSPFACNTDVYCKKKLPYIYDVTFVGQYHPQREWHINYLKKAGIDVRVWGKGWPSGAVRTTDDMVNIFNQSRINLNLSNCVSWDIRYLVSPCRPIKNTLRTWRQAMRSMSRPDMKTVEQVKGRHFEVSACGGFQLSYYVEGLERLYAIGDEIALFNSPEDLLEKSRYYLKYSEEAGRVALRSYERTLRDHTMERRVGDILIRLGLN